MVGAVAVALQAQKQKLQLLYENVAALEKQLQEEETKVLPLPLHHFSLLYFPATRV